MIRVAVWGVFFVFLTRSHGGLLEAGAEGNFLLFRFFFLSFFLLSFFCLFCLLFLSSNVCSERDYYRGLALDYSSHYIPLLYSYLLIKKIIKRQAYYENNIKNNMFASFDNLKFKLYLHHLILLTFS